MIRSDPEGIEQIRARLSKMSDHELRKFGRAARDLSDPKKNFGTPIRCSRLKLEEAMAEWGRTHPKGKAGPSLPSVTP